MLIRLASRFSEPALPRCSAAGSQEDGSGTAKTGQHSEAGPLHPESHPHELTDRAQQSRVGNGDSALDLPMVEVDVACEPPSRPQVATKCASPHSPR